jgi:3'-phosphoadenosine 5'-phosphosulfate sulfotransferase (PAPS reductase)/FAD synthetase
MVAASQEILDAKYAEHQPVAIYLMFSGGHDSLTATHVGATWAQERGHPFEVCHINTGIGIEQTRQFVRQTCWEQGWNLRELRADRKEQEYEWIVTHTGFPGPGGHSYMYRRLKERKVERLVREAKVGHSRMSRVMLVTGMRRAESVRRMAHGDIHFRRGGQAWTAPLEHWSKTDCNAYIDWHDLPRNEVVDLLHMSGECLCGSFARVDEMQDLEHWFPEEATRIHELEAIVESLGHASCIWGYAARPNAVNRSQGHLTLPLCVVCEESLTGVADRGQPSSARATRPSSRYRASCATT